MTDLYASHQNFHTNRSGGGFSASQMPIKNRVKNIDNQVKDLNKGLNEDKKEAQLLRSECASLEHHQSELSNDILKEILEDVANLERDFRKLQHMDNNEMNFLKQQGTQLQHEKMRLQQATVLLDNKISNIEGDVGYE